MISLIVVIILIACAVLAFFILVQNPKGGGLTGGFGSLSTQVMGVKQSTDIMEKGTWATMGIIAALSIMLILFYPKPENANAQRGSKQSTSTPAQQAAPAKGKK